MKAGFVKQKELLNSLTAPIFMPRDMTYIHFFFICLNNFLLNVYYFYRLIVDSFTIELNMVLNFVFLILKADWSIVYNLFICTEYFLVFTLCLGAKSE